MQMKADKTPVFDALHERTRNHTRDAQTNLSGVYETIFSNEMIIYLPLKAEYNIHKEHNKSDGLDW